MKKLLLVALLLPPTIIIAQTTWKPANFQLPTRWSKEVSPSNALPEYPRPQMVRGNWQNLNGLWDYTITPKDSPPPVSYEGQILVPYPIESALSGVKKALLPAQNLWYRRTFTKPDAKNGEHILLQFGAVDWQATVFLNGKQVGSHSGGYQHFTIDITDNLEPGDNELTIKVYDPTDQGIGPHGKQVLNPQNIYYTASSGIWQTVWLEIVPAQYIAGMKIVPDIDKAVLNVKVDAPNGSTIELTASDGTKVIVKKSGIAGSLIQIPVPNARLWSPADPFLYNLEVKLVKNGKAVDEVKSYFGMRKIAINKDAQGIDRIFLNNKPYYNLGVLDQGFWPDGIYTAPTDEALSFDIRAIKAMGFNTIRKHIKVEPARWYYYADKLGMLVWQDMVNPNQGLPEGAKAEFEKESASIVDQLYNSPSIVTWVLFNEKWGQYDQERLTRWLKNADPSRIVNGHTGEILYVNEELRSPSPNAYVAADMTDVHSYPDPMMPIKQPGKAQVLGEFGGIGVFIADHQWNTSAWGYVQEKPANLQAKYEIMNQHLKLLEREGLSGSIYTQPFDVEGEQNGLMTYDREVIKIPFDTLRKIHAALNPDMGTIPDVAIKNADLTDPGLLYSRMLQEFIDGKRDTLFLKKMAIAASQAGDKPGAQIASSSYIASLHPPLQEEDIQFISQFTKSTKDPGFLFMQANSDQFKKALGERQYIVNMMNMIFHGEMESLLDGNDNPDWSFIETKVKPYGPPGEEILLRAKTVHYLNHQDWANYVPTAKAYLAKYGANIRKEELTMFQNAIDQNKKNN